MTRWLNGFQPIAVLIMRLLLGACMIHYGYPKVLPKGALDATAHWVVSMHLPYWLGYVSAITEFAGGILLVLGLMTRLASFLVMINMLFAFALVGIHGRPEMYFFQLALAAIAFTLVCCGPGALALDRRLGFA